MPPIIPLRDDAIAAGFHAVLVVPLVDQQGFWDRWWCCAKPPGIFAKPESADADLRASGGAGDAQSRGCSTEVDQKRAANCSSAHSRGSSKAASFC